MAQPSAPSQPAPTAPRKSLFKRWWFWAAIVIVAIIVIATSASGGGGGDPSSAGSAPTTQERAPSTQAASTPPPTAQTTVAPPTAQADDPLSDGGWTVSDIQVKQDEFGTGISARVTNTETDTRTGVFTLTIFAADGTRIYEAQGSAGDVEAGQTATVTFIGSTEKLPGDPSTYRYEFQSDL